MLPPVAASLPPQLNQPWPTERAGPPLTPAAVSSLVCEVLHYLLTSYRNLPPLPTGADAAARRTHLQALLTVLPPTPALPPVVQVSLDRLLQHELRAKPVIAASSLPRLREAFPTTAYAAAARCALWQGDITHLRADAIVNAANAQLLGCFQPFHRCIDNAIHAAAGPRLREDCYAQMQAQDRPEATGTAKITLGYNLPARYVLHTVGPIVPRGLAPTANQRAQLADCYRACLDLAQLLPTVRSVAFCGISTGIFGFPAAEAAGIALTTVAAWLQAYPDALDVVVFNVFSDQDREHYAQALATFSPLLSA